MRIANAKLREIRLSTIPSGTYPRKRVNPSGNSQFQLNLAEARFKKLCLLVANRTTLNWAGYCIYPLNRGGS